LKGEEESSFSYDQSVKFLLIAKRQIKYNTFTGEALS